MDPEAAESVRSNGVNGTNGTKPYGKMSLMEAARLMERLQGRAAHAGEVEALRVARDALLTLVAEGYTTLGDRLRHLSISSRSA
jgi:hypothetical protein